MSGISPRVRQIVLERDSWMCQRCGRYVFGQPYSLQHRRPRGMGGSKRPETNLPANLITLCGTATSPGGCHLAVESDRLRATADGFLVSQHADPELIPVKTWRGRAWLTNDGMLTLVGEAS